MNINNIPEYLRKNGYFCLWRYEDRDGRRTKVPYNPHDPRYGAKSNDRSTFSDLQTAAGRMDGFNGLGVGVFDGLAGIDIDHCIIDDKLSDMAAEIVKAMDSYTEVSPSGEGIRIFFKASGYEFDKSKYYLKNSAIGLEVYLSGMTNRYLTITGNAVHKVPVMQREDRLPAILDKYMKRPAKDPVTPVNAAPLDLTDRELIDRAKAAKNGAQFSSLWDGSTVGYPSHSEADQALCNILAFWTGKDPHRMDALFRQSGLMREKWDRKQSGTTYGKITISNAVSACKEVYTPPKDRVEDAQRADNGQGKEPPTNEAKTPENAVKTPVELFDDFMAKIQTESYRPMKTGMPAFDQLLGGGILRQSLVILSAAPGAGKTTLASQIFEVMAKNGTDCVFLNLEMSREQLLARSLARILYRKGHKMSAAKVLQGYGWSEEQKKFVMEAAAEYRSNIATHMHYNPAGSMTSLTGIQSTLEKAGEAAKASGKAGPVVVLDYLHLVTSENREEQAELIKKTVAMLKNYAVRYDTFVFLIAANNRQSNVSGVVSQDSGRDSSAIEYSADYQLGLNFKGLAEREKNSKGEVFRANNPDDMDELMQGDAQGRRSMVVQVLKNRMNAPGGKLYLLFDPVGSVFYPVEEKKKNFGFTRVTNQNSDDIPFL